MPLSRLELFLEGDIGNPPRGVPTARPCCRRRWASRPIRVKVLVEGDAPRDVLDAIVSHANFYSPVANSMRNRLP